MKATLAALALVAGVSLASVIIGSPEIPSMDPFCAS
jgi:hypothetical protein